MYYIQEEHVYPKFSKNYFQPKKHLMEAKLVDKTIWIFSILTHKYTSLISAIIMTEVRTTFSQQPNMDNH